MALTIIYLTGMIACSTVSLYYFTDGRAKKGFVWLGFAYLVLGVWNI